MRIYLLRDGETAYNAQKKYLGRTDLSLSERGRGALTRADFNPGTVYVSPLCRTAQTADILFPEAGQIVVPDLREMDFGIFEGKSWRDMEDFPPYRQWVDGGCQGKIPEGESREKFSARTCAAFGDLVEQALKAGSDPLVIVAHGGTQMAVMERYALPRQDYFSWNGPLGGGFVLDAGHWRDQRVLILLDTVRYARGG